MISDLSEDYNETDLGSKGLRLLELVADGYPVPKFLVITVSEVNSLLTNNLSVNVLCKNISEKLVCHRYAVRSAALSEDSKISSMAGQFMTKLDVSECDLPEAIFAVISDAKEKLESGSNKFSIIVQEFIEPDLAGVLYTRNPISGREMVVEYGYGRGDKIVGGEKVEKISFIYKATKLEIKGLDFIQDLANLAHNLEVKYDFPQDIEWLVKDGQVHILQTRPITSISDNQWRGTKLVEKEVSKLESDFFFERTTLSETFGHPRPLAFSLLKELYKASGPIERAYKRLGVSYQANNSLRQFGNEVYVNKELEIKSLYPALGYLKSGHSKAKLELNFGIFKTLKNFLSLTFAPSNLHEKLSKEMEEVLAALPEKTQSLEESILLINRHYELVFLINILASQAVFKLTTNLGKQNSFVPTLLSHQVEQSKILRKNLRGNSFNLDDTTDFVSYSEVAQDNADFRQEAWWLSLSDWKRRGLTVYIERAKKFSALRERARYLSVVLINLFRQCVEQSRLLNGDDKDLVYYATVSELVLGKVNQMVLKDRQRAYFELSSIQTPAVVASFVKEENTPSAVLVVSPGIASGVFVSQEAISNTAGAKILVTDILSPDLVKYFDRVEGIVSREGGLLSHLAIMAREAGVPVVVSNQLSSEGILGKSGTIDEVGGITINK